MCNYSVIYGRKKCYILFIGIWIGNLQILIVYDPQNFTQAVCSKRDEILPVLRKVAGSGKSGLWTNWCRGCFLMVCGFIIWQNLHSKTNKNDTLRDSLLSSSFYFSYIKQP